MPRAVQLAISQLDNDEAVSNIGTSVGYRRARKECCVPFGHIEIVSRRIEMVSLPHMKFVAFLCLQAMRQDRQVSGGLLTLPD